MTPRAWQRRDPAQRRMNCLQVTRVLQSYLDGETDEITARRVAVHLESCRRCGLGAATYHEIKKALARRGTPEGQSVERLREFGESLLRDSEEPGGTEETPPGAAG